MKLILRVYLNLSGQESRSSSTDTPVDTRTIPPKVRRTRLLHQPLPEDPDSPRGHIRIHLARCFWSNYDQQSRQRTAGHRDPGHRRQDLWDLQCRGRQEGRRSRPPHHQSPRRMQMLHSQSRHKDLCSSRRRPTTCTDCPHNLSYRRSPQNRRHRQSIHRLYWLHSSHR